MHTISLEQELQQVISFCKEHSISLFKGSLIPTTSLIEIDWQEEDEASNVFEYLKVLKAIGAPVLILEENRYTEYHTYQALSKERLLVLEEHAEKKELISALKRLEKYKECLLSFTLSFLKEGVLYTLSKDAPWEKDYFLVPNLLGEDPFGDEEEEEDEPTNHEFSEEEMDVLARKLIADPTYQSAKDHKERAAIAYQWYRRGTIKELPNLTFLRVKARAEELYHQEVLPELEKELGEEIRELKRKGEKKVAVKAKLKISEAVINRHWYE